MIISGKKLGDMYVSNEDNVITKEEYKKAVKDGTVRGLVKPLSYSHKRFIACSVLEDSLGIIVEDSQGKLHIASIGALVRTGIDIDELLVLPDVELDLATTPVQGDLFDIVDLGDRQKEAAKRLAEKNKGVLSD